MPKDNNYKPIIYGLILENDCLEFSSWSSESNDI